MRRVFTRLYKFLIAHFLEGAKRIILAVKMGVADFFVCFVGLLSLFVFMFVALTKSSLS